LQVRTKRTFTVAVTGISSGAMGHGLDEYSIFFQCHACQCPALWPCHLLAQRVMMMMMPCLSVAQFPQHQAADMFHTTTFLGSKGVAYATQPLGSTKLCVWCAGIACSAPTPATHSHLTWHPYFTYSFQPVYLRLLHIPTIPGLNQLSSLTLHASFIDFDSTDGSAMLNNGQRTTTPGCGLHSVLAESLPQLTALTRLAVEHVADTAILKHAPPQLVELEAMGVDDQCTRWETHY